MSVFDPDSDLSGDVAFELMAASFVRLFWRPSLLQEAVDWLLAHDYQMIRLDASGWTSEGDLHRDVAQALDFPEYYGRNLDALNDCIGDVTGFQYGARPDATGLVLVFTGYDRFAAHCPRPAHVVLDIIADHARSSALFGHRVLCLVQSDDPGISFEPVGAMPVLWNRAEWLNASRRMDQP